MRLLVGNSWAELSGAPRSFLDALTRHLAVPLGDDPGVQRAYSVGPRFGSFFWATANGERQLWGSLVHDTHVASGLVPHVMGIAQHYGHALEVRDCRQRPADEMPLWSVRGVAWRPYQNTVHQQILTHSCGVVDAPPRSGKTLMAARAIDTLAHPALWLSPSVAIGRQTYEVLKKHFGSDYVARVDSDATPAERDISKHFVVATVQSAVTLPPEWFATRRMLVIDEFHHSAAETYHKLNALAESIYYRLCWTGTHFRTGDDALAMNAVCSTVLHTIRVADLVQEGFLAPARVVFVPAPRDVRPIFSRDRWAEVYQEGIVEWEPRNNLIAHIARTLDANGIPTLVLTRRRAHAEALSQMISGSQTVMGGDGALVSRQIADFNEGRLSVLVGTQVIGEGVDVPRAGALIYACGGNEGVQQMQSYFRPLTAYPGKSVGLIYDVTDSQHRMLLVHSRRRQAIAEEALGSVVRLGESR